VPGLLGELHLHEDVAGEELARGLDGLLAATLGDLLGRHEDLAERVLERLALDPFLERLLHRVLVARERVDDEPLSDWF
jgi:hypothetical protein